jgi:hypothetical protein
MIMIAGYGTGALETGGVKEVRRVTLLAAGALSPRVPL